VHTLWTVTDGVTLRLKQDSYPPDTETITLVLENHSDSVILYGQSCSFEKYENGKWSELETVPDASYSAAGNTLFDHDQCTLSISTDCLKTHPLSEGTYRLTGSALTAMPYDPVQLYGCGMRGQYYPPYQLEFTISDTAPEDAATVPEEHLSRWQLPEKDDWQWYTPTDCVKMYKDADMEPFYYPEGENGLMAVVYGDNKDNAVSGMKAGDLLLMDIFDRKTGERYKVFPEPLVEYPGTEEVYPYLDGFEAKCGDMLFYCFINSADKVEITLLNPAAGTGSNDTLRS